MNWYLLYYKRGQLGQVKQGLTRQNVVYYSLMMSIKKWVKGKEVLKQEPLFERYLFVNFDIEATHSTSVRSRSGGFCALRGV